MTEIPMAEAEAIIYVISQAEALGLECRDYGYAARLEKERDELRVAAQAVVDAAPSYTAKGGSIWKLDHELDALRDALSRTERGSS